MITQEDREQILDMHRRGLSGDNIAAIIGVELNIVGVVTAQEAVQQQQLPRPKKKAPEVKPDVPFIDMESIGVQENWSVDGLCRNGGYDPDLWFPSPTEFNLMKLAQRVCYRCPVIMECRSMALARGERNGVWGGLTETQRKKMRKAEAAAAKEAEGEAEAV